MANGDTSKACLRAPSPWHHHFDASTTSQLKRVEKGVCESRVTTGFFLSIHMGGSKNRGFSPQIIHFNRVFHYKPSILGYPYFWKHPYVSHWISRGIFQCPTHLPGRVCFLGVFSGFLLFFFLVDFLSKIDDLWSSSSTAWAHLFDGLSFLHCDD